MAYFDENDPVRKQLEERFTNTGLGPTISVDPVTGETSLGVKKNPTARDWQKAYEGYIRKGGSPLTSSDDSSATRLGQHPINKSRGLSYFSGEPYRASFLQGIQEDIATEEAPATVSAPATSVRQFTEQYQDQVSDEPNDVFAAPEGYGLGRVHDTEYTFKGGVQSGDPLAWSGAPSAPPDAFASVKQTMSEINERGVWDVVSGNVVNKFNSIKNDPGSAAVQGVVGVGTAHIADLLFGSVGTAALVADKILDIDWAATQIGRWGENDTDGSPSQISGYNSQGIAVDSKGNAVLSNGMYQYQSFSHWTSHFGGTFTPEDPAGPATTGGGSRHVSTGPWGTPTDTSWVGGGTTTGGGRVWGAEDYAGDPRGGEQNYTGQDDDGDPSGGPGGGIGTGGEDVSGVGDADDDDEGGYGGGGIGVGMGGYGDESW